MEELYLDDKSEQNEELIEENKKNKSFITFSKLNKLFLIPFLYAIFYFLIYLFEYLIDKSEVIKRPQFIKSILYDLSHVIAGLFYCIPSFQVNVNIKKKSNKKEKLDIAVDYIYNKNFGSIINTKKDIMLILLLSLMLSLDDLLWVFIIKGNTFDERIFYLFIIPLFSKIILKENIYKHQYFSILISLIGGIFLIIPTCFILTKKDIIPNILDFIEGIIYPLFLVIIKYVAEKYYYPPLKMCLIIGILSIIINVSGYSIYSYIIGDFSLFIDCLDFSKINKLVIYIYFILFFLFLIATQFTLIYLYFIFLLLLLWLQI